MTIRPILLAALAAFATPGLADEPPPAKTEKSALAGSVAALNTIFKRDTDGTVANRYLGRVVAVSGKVKQVSAADGGGRTLTLAGLAPTATDPAGCTVAFPAGHPSLEAVGQLTPGTAVVIRGKLDTVTGMAFTLKDPILMPVRAPLAQVPPPAPKRPAPKRPRPEAKPDPVPDEIVLRPDDLKTTVVALTAKLRGDKTERVARAYDGREIELTGRVDQSFRVPAERGGGWHLSFLGSPSDYAGDPYSVGLTFPPDSPDLPRLRNVVEGDTVTVRGRMELPFGRLVSLRGGRLVSGGEKPPPALVPVRAADSTAFVRELVTDPAAADKALGQAVTLTGVIQSAGPKYHMYGLSLRAGKLRSADLYEMTARCVVADDQLEAVWQLPPGLKVQVVGVVRQVEKDAVKLTRCRVTLLEPNPTPTLTAAELAAAFRADPAAAAKKYGDAYAEKWLYLTGEVAALTPSQYAPNLFTTIIVLKVPAGPKVDISSLDAKGLKVGQAVRFKAVCRGLTKDQSGVRADGDLLPETKTALPLAK